MGDRISVSFVSKDGNSEDESVTLFHHWGGREFLNEVQRYFKELRTEQKKNQSKGFNPLDRLEPRTVMIDFIRWLTKGMKRVESSLYLGVDENDGDNSDNGHYRIDVKTGREYMGPADFKKIRKPKAGE